MWLALEMRSNERALFPILRHLSAYLYWIKMPMCASDCNCRWCRLVEMACHPLFSERVDALLALYNQSVPLKPRAKALPDDDSLLY